MNLEQAQMHTADHGASETTNMAAAENDEELSLLLQVVIDYKTEKAGGWFRF